MGFLASKPDLGTKSFSPDALSLGIFVSENPLIGEKFFAPVRDVACSKAV